MKKLISKALLAVIFTVGLVASVNAEDFSLKYEPITYLYRIEVDSKPIWELPLTQVETVTKSEWHDIDTLINLVSKTYSYGTAVRAMVNTLGPKRFIVKGN